MSCSLTSIFAVPLAQAVWRIKMNCQNVQKEAARIRGISSMVGCEVNLARVIYSLLNITQSFVLETSVLVHTADQLMSWQRMEKTDTRKVNKNANNQSYTEENSFQA